MKTFLTSFAAILLSITCSLTAAANLTVAPDHADGCYEVGEAVTWTITGGTEPLNYTVQAGGLTAVSSGKLTFADGKATVSAKLDHPGTLLLTLPMGEKKLHAGAAVGWSQIKPSAPQPEDFDAFWKDKLAELAGIAPNTILEPVDSGSPDVQLWKITMDNIHGSKIHGYLARPKGTAPAPAMLQVQHAGTLGLKKEWVVGPAKKGWLALNIVAHDFPVDRDDAFYKAQFDGPLKDYMHQGADDREKNYYLRVYLGCYRAADYLSKRDDWNKSTLLVQGVSMGGMQGLVTAGLHPAVTVLTVDVPAGCDQTGTAVGRAVGFPYWGGNPAFARSAGYYDTVNFARHIHCPVLIGMGLSDVTCPSEGVFAMYNQIPSPKRIAIMPEAEHKGNHAAYERAKITWWTAALEGQPLPMK